MANIVGSYNSEKETTSMNTNRYEKPALVTSGDAFTAIRAPLSQKHVDTTEIKCGSNFYACNAYGVDE